MRFRSSLHVVSSLYPLHVVLINNTNLRSIPCFLWFHSTWYWALWASAGSMMLWSMHSGNLWGRSARFPLECLCRAAAPCRPVCAAPSPLLCLGCCYILGIIPLWKVLDLWRLKKKAVKQENTNVFLPINHSAEHVCCWYFSVAWAEISQWPLLSVTH